jgi:hypothetical protein
MSRVLAFAALSMLAMLGWADDGHVIENGTAYHIGGVTRIRMVDEHVTILLSEDFATVKCHFTFRNEGPAETATIGFPDRSGGEGGHAPAMTDFTSTVDGTPVQTKLADNGSDPNDQYWNYFHVKKVQFARGQTRVIEDSYRTPLGYGVGVKWSFTYVMSTGGSWYGNIGSAILDVTVAGRHDKTPVRIAQVDHYRGNAPVSPILWRGFAMPTVKGSTLTFSRKNFKPTKRSDVALLVMTRI